MNEISTEKLLPQGLQDILNAKRECMAQANDINNEIIDREMKTLHLPLKAKWYEMIDSGVKTEEYREIKPYWCDRLLGNTPLGREYWGITLPRTFKLSNESKNISTSEALRHLLIWNYGCRGYTHVKFSYGYTKRTMTFEIESITVGKGNPEWGAPTEEVFIIKLGKRV